MKFVKMQANGDDFVVIDARTGPNPVDANVARFLGDRNRGIGFNQLAVMLPCNDAAARLVFWNPDGTNLGACGSATRGVAHLMMKETGSPETNLRTERGILQCLLTHDGQISVDMGAPLLDWREIPLAKPCDTLRLPLDGEPVACGMGNPHCTFFVDDLSAIDPWSAGPRIECHPLFPEKTNVHFVQILDRKRIRMRIWERGGGVPAGSGSCSCGAAVAAIRRGLVDNEVEVICDGGSVSVSWKTGSGAWLTGRAAVVFHGEIAPQ
jgi:diaminopimelate epimerase